MKVRHILLAILALALVGCSTKSPTAPSSQSLGLRTTAPTTGRTAPGQPGYEPAYEDNNTVTINAIEIPGKVPAVAQADFYEVVYPPDWQALGIAPPQCSPCDHDGNGIDFLDYHDHVLDSAPGDVGYRAPWHVRVLVPAYNGDPTHDAAIGQIYKAALPIKSEADVLGMAQQHLPSGAPVAVMVDPDFYFLCAIVNANAAK